MYMTDREIMDEVLKRARLIKNKRRKRTLCISSAFAVIFSAVCFINIAPQTEKHIENTEAPPTFAEEKTTAVHLDLYEPSEVIQKDADFDSLDAMSFYIYIDGESYVMINSSDCEKFNIDTQSSFGEYLGNVGEMNKNIETSEKLLYGCKVYRCESGDIPAVFVKKGERYSIFVSEQALYEKK